jgi:hypothetical protein
MHNIRAEILGGPEERKARVLRQKAPKQANGTALTGVVIPREETRRTDMRHEDRPAADGRVFNVNFRDRIHEVSVINLSGGGAMIAASLDANIGERMDLHVGKGDVVQCVVRWKKGDRLGLEFAHETQLECSEETRTKVLRARFRSSLVTLTLRQRASSPSQTITGMLLGIRSSGQAS